MTTTAAKRVPRCFQTAQIERPKRSVRRHLLVGVEGETGTGKSTFVLDAPDPMFILNYDNGLRLILDNRLDEGWDHVVGIHTVKLPPTVNKDADKKLLEEAQKKYLAAAQDPDVRTLAIDTGKQLWEHVRRAVLGQLLQVPPILYTGANATFKWFMETADYYKKNLIVTWPMGDEYVGGKDKKGNPIEIKSGKRVRSGKGDAEEMVELHIRMEKDINIPEVPDKFSLRILKCRPNTALEGEVIEGMLEPECLGFVGLAMKVFPASKRSEWE
jgi:hypothetical protein